MLTSDKIGVLQENKRASPWWCVFQRYECDSPFEPQRSS